MNCDPLARWYWVLEALSMGLSLTRRRNEFLTDLTDDTLPRRALLLGDGDGRFLSALLCGTTMGVDYVDSSAKMLAQAHRRATNALGREAVQQRINFSCADALEWRPPAARIYDVVITHFFLDCLTQRQVDTLISRLDPFLAPEAVWIISEFHQPERGFAAWRARLWIGILYRLFGWATGLTVRRLPDYRASLEAQGFYLENEVVANLGLLVSERWRRRRDGFCVDAPASAQLHSRTPKS